MAAALILLSWLQGLPPSEPRLKDLGGVVTALALERLCFFLNDQLGRSHFWRTTAIEATEFALVTPSRFELRIICVLHRGLTHNGITRSIGAQRTRLAPSCFCSVAERDWYSFIHEVLAIVRSTKSPRSRPHKYRIVWVGRNP